jgi:hypothetical protein
LVSQLEPGLAVKARCPANTPTTCEEGSTQHPQLYYRHLSFYCGSSLKRPGLTPQQSLLSLRQLSLFWQQWHRTDVPFISPAGTNAI